MSVTQITPEQVAEALTRVGQAYRILEKVSTLAVQEEAQWLRLALLLFAQEHPVQGFSYTAEFQYDDEGGYFETVAIEVTDFRPGSVPSRCFPTCAHREHLSGEDWASELMDITSPASPEGVRLLIPYGYITVEGLQEGLI